MIRNPGPGKNSQGLILLDQFFAVPQVGEIIRDLLILERLASTIENRKEDHQGSKESL